jgi:hypothetical protein
MGEYVIWCGEKLLAKYPQMTWQQAMDIVTRDIDLGEEFSIEAYLKEVK